MMEKLIEITNKVIETYGPKLIGSILVLFLGLWLVRVLVKVFTRMLERSEVDATLKPFLRSLISIGLRTLLFITVLGMMGVQMTSFIAILGTAGLAIGMALSGTLQNFAGGVMILLFKPIKKGDYIEAQGHAGTVHEIQVFNTILKTPDNVTIIIPNGGLSTGSMVNYSSEKERRVDRTFGIGYGDSTSQARQVLAELIEADQRIKKDPPPVIHVSELGDSSVNFVVRAWVKSSDFWAVFFEMNEKVYNTFNAQGLNIPFPQMDVHVHQNK